MWNKGTTSRLVSSTPSALTHPQQMQMNGMSLHHATGSSQPMNVDSAKSKVKSTVSPSPADDDAFHLESIVNLEKECQKALSIILPDPLSASAVTAEQQLWGCFIKYHKVHLVSFV